MLINNFTISVTWLVCECEKYDENHNLYAWYKFTIIWQKDNQKDK